MKTKVCPRAIIKKTAKAPKMKLRLRSSFETTCFAFVFYFSYHFLAWEVYILLSSCIVYDYRLRTECMYVCSWLWPIVCNNNSTDWVSQRIYNWHTKKEKNHHQHLHFERLFWRKPFNCIILYRRLLFACFWIFLSYNWQTSMKEVSLFDTNLTLDVKKSCLSVTNFRLNMMFFIVFKACHT